ncbi:MAG: universal stress protein [Cyanobacteria bacterium]|nr:universal stress protein [Cyanobacteriota bacterium]
MNAGPVIAAIDLGPLTPRVLYHAAAFARLFGAPLEVLHVNGDTSRDTRERVLNACVQLGPYQVDFDDGQVAIRTGHVSDAIAREAIASDAALVVMGSRRHSAVAKFTLGSTSEAVLRNATTVVLLVPPIDMDIVSIGDRVSLTSGAVIAAVDLAEESGEQLQMAAAIAQLGAQPLLLMTVAKSRVTDHQASEDLRERAHRMTVKPHSLIVRRGSVAKEISRCAVVEGSGLVVMGLRATPRCQPGGIASAVLKTDRAFVLAVPNRRAKAVETWRRIIRRLPMIAASAALIALASARSAAQSSFADVDAIVAFQRAADSYAFLHRQVERRLGQVHRRAGLEPDVIESVELAKGILAERPTTSPGQFFTPTAAAAISARLVAVLRAGCDAGELYSGTWHVVRIGGSAQGTRPVTECVAAALPRLPPELAFRSVAGVLILADMHADVAVDVLHGPLSFTSTR